MAHECGIEFDLMDVCAIFKRTPYIADLKPGGKYVAKDVFDIGGVPQIMRALLDGGYLHEDCLTVTGKTIKQNLENVKFNTNQKVVYPVSNPISPTGGVVGLQGSLAPDGAIVKVASMTKLSFVVRRSCSTARRTASAPSRTAATRTATFSSSATRAPRAAPACARCFPPLRRSMARVPATKLP